MKQKLFILLAITAGTFNQVSAQVNVDKSIQLTGASGSDRRITGLGTITDTADAADVSSIQKSKLTYALATGAVNTYAVSLSVSPVSHATGLMVNFKSNAANTGAVTLNVNSLGAKTVLKNATDALVSGDIKSGQIVCVIYDGTNFQVLSQLSGSGLSGTAGGVLAGTYPNPTFAAGAVTNADIVAAAGIPYSKLTLTNSVTNTDVMANTITTSKVANGTVTTSKMADSAISGLKLLTNAVQTKHILDGNVTLAKMSSSGAVSGNAIIYNGSSIAWGSVPLRYSRTAISNINSPYTVLSTSEIIGVDVTAGPVTVTLPPANAVPSGKVVIIKNELGNAATNNITIQRNGTDLINSASTSVTISTGTATGSFNFYSDGVSRWHQF